MITALLLFAAQAAVPAAPATAKPPPEKMKCQLIYQANSRIPDKLCMPQSEWDRIAKENRDDLGSTRNLHAGGLSGTVANYGPGGEISIGTPTAMHANGPGPH